MSSFIDIGPDLATELTTQTGLSVELELPEEFIPQDGAVTLLTARTFGHGRLDDTGDRFSTDVEVTLNTFGFYPTESLTINAEIAECLVELHRVSDYTIQAVYVLTDPQIIGQSQPSGAVQTTSRIQITIDQEK